MSHAPRRPARFPLHPAVGLPLFLAVLALVACAEGGGDPQASPEGPGRLVIVGGALSPDNAAVYHAVLEARDGEGPVCVLPTASGVPQESMATAVERLAGYAADPRYEGDRPEVVGIDLTTDNPEAASAPEVVARMEGCSGYWFVGGAQSRIVRTFRPAAGDAPAYDALMRRWREGAVVAGTSAGAAMMSSRSIGGGSPAAALESGVTGTEDGAGVWVLPGMDLVPWGIVGQHHLARGRWGRLVVAALEGPDPMGVGIDENTALVWDDGEAVVVGASGVLLVDVSGAVPGEAPRTAAGIRLELLAPGDRLDTRTLAVARVVAGKERPTSASVAAAAGEEVLPTLAELQADPFARWAMPRLLARMAAGEVDEVALDGGARALTLRKGPGFLGLVDPGGAMVAGSGTPAGLSVGPLVLDLALP